MDRHPTHDEDRGDMRSDPSMNEGSASKADDGEADTPAPRKTKGRADWYQKTSAASLGIEMAIAIVLCTFAGLWLQNNVTHWQPWTMLIGFGFGVGAAVNAIMRVIREEEAARLEREAARRAAASAEDIATADHDRSPHASGPHERERG